MNLISNLILTLLSPFCFIPPPEMLYNYDELIDNTETILLIECTSIDTIYLKKKQKKLFHVDYFINYDFKILELLKGTNPKEIEWRNTRNVVYRSDHFNNHNDTVFWNQAVGRSIIPTGACGASHSFVLNNKYLYFLGSTANRKSTECVNDPEDAWLNYVRDRLK